MIREVAGTENRAQVGAQQARYVAVEAPERPLIVMSVGPCCELSKYYGY